MNARLPNRDWLPSLALILLTILVYLPGLPGGFVFDDLWNIVDNPAFQAITHSGSPWQALWQAIWSGTAGPLGRPLTVFTLALNYLIGGASPLGYKLVNIAIHAINGVIVYQVIKLVMRRADGLRTPHLVPAEAGRSTRHLTWVVALLWVIHPINLTSVLYVVQRMTSLSGLFVLLGIWGYLRLRERCMGPNHVRETYASLFLVILAGVAAALSKETGLMLFAYLFVVECGLFGFQGQSSSVRRIVMAFFVITLVVPMSIGGYLMLTHGWFSGGYSGRDFDLTQRLLTESRVLWVYLRMILSPSLHGLALFHDDFPLSKGLLHPASTLFALAGLALLAVVAWRSRTRWPLFALGVFWFLVGHLMESTVVPLELVHEHRNYLPSLGIVLVLVLGMERLAITVSRHRVLPPVLLGMLALLLGGVTMMRSAAWSDPITQMEVEIADHPGSTRAHYELAVNYLRLEEMTKNGTYLARARRQLYLAVTADPADLNAMVGMVMVDSMMGQRPSPEFITGLSHLLSDSSLSGMVLGNLRRLVHCQIEGRCHIEAHTVRRLIDGVLAHPRLIPKYRTQMLKTREALGGMVSGNAS